MCFLHKRQYYLDRYDLFTINACLVVLKVRDTMYKDKKLQRKYPNGKHKYEVDKIIHRQMFLTKAHEYQQKEKTIEKWIDEDRKIQKKYDSAVSPNIKCDQCGRQLKELDRSFEGYNSLTDKISFTMICDDCREVKRVYGDGSEVVPVPDRCVKCNRIVEVDRTFTEDITKSFYKCNKCGYECNEEYNDEDFMQQFEEEKKKDKILLAKYRSEFCLNQEEGDNAVDVLEQVRFAQEVYEYEIEKYKGDEKERTFNIQRLTAQELEKLLNSKLVPEGFIKLSFGRVVLDKFVTVPFSIQDSDTERRKEESIAVITKLCNEVLVNTNWRLVKSDVMYRLGYISGTLKGYEREDIEKLLGNSPPKKKNELDPERMSKYGYSNVVRLAKICADYEGKEILRKKKLEALPNGYYLESEDDNSFRCAICDKWTCGRDVWYDKYGMRCTTCQNNISQGVIPANLCSKKKTWFSSEHIRHQFGIVASTMRKLIMTGELKGVELKNRDSKPYLTIFLKKDNKDFLAKYPEKEFGLPVVIKDEQGREIRL